MKLHVSALSIAAMLALAPVVHSQEIAGNYKQFGFLHATVAADKQLERYKADSAECNALASERAETSRKNADPLSEVYGISMSQADLYGVAFVGCMTGSAKHQGKEWLVYEKQGDQWRQVTDRYALRTFLGLDPNQ